MELTAPTTLALLVAVVTGFWALAKILIAQVFRQLDERFAAQETARSKSQEHWELRFVHLETQAKGTEKELLLLRGDLPNLYVRREDYIRGQTVIESKLDALHGERDSYVRREDHIRSETVVHAKLDALAKTLIMGKQNDQSTTKHP